MTSQTDRTAGDLDWVDFAERTPAAERERTSKFDVPTGRAIDEVEQELERVGVDDWRLSTAAPHRQKDGRPYANANPDDPGVVVRWTMDGAQYAVACDHYTKMRDNIRAVGLYLREKRKMDNRPVKTGQSEFATARLPGEEAYGGREDALAVEPEPHEVLGVAPDAPESVVKGAARQLKKEKHPDTGGGAEELQRVMDAEEEMLESR
jgi:hypothetical protein